MNSMFRCENNYIRGNSNLRLLEVSAIIQIDKRSKLNIYKTKTCFDMLSKSIELKIFMMIKGVSHVTLHSGYY